MDPLLLFAALGAGLFSIFTLPDATTERRPRRPLLLRRAPERSTSRSAITRDVRRTRIDYSRFRELRVGIYTFMFVSIALVFVFGAAARGSRRAFELPFFSFQPSELGKVLLILALAGFVIDGARRGSERQRDRALPRCSGWRPRHSSSYSQTSAPLWCSGS